MHDKIYLSRNRFKKQHKVYIHEALKNIAEAKSKEIFGKKSVSEFLCFSAYLIAGKFGCKFSYLNKKDINKIKALHRAISVYK